MVTKKSLKTKVTVSNQDKTKRSLSDCNNKKAIFVSQKVIINSIFDKCFIEPNVDYTLPDHISDIFREMICDASHINETLTNKDYSFYDYRMGFYEAEKSISMKRKAIVEFMLKTNRESLDTTKQPLISQKKPRKIVKPKQKETESIPNNTAAPIDNKSDRNSLVRTQRKRKKPTKFDSLTEPPERMRRSDKEPIQLIDLAVDSSSDGEPLRSTLVPILPSPESRGPPKPGCKVYFREPNASTAPPSASRKSTLTTTVSTTASQRRVKQHTLLDKVLLGVNCVRQATDRGLHLSRLCEADLGLLNKRLASVDNVRLAELEEHTDDNNNRSLSVLLQAPGLLPVITANTSNSPGSSLESIEPRDTPEPSQTYIRPQKSSMKPHVPAMYRQRHYLPGILAKPSGLLCDEHTRSSISVAPIKFEPDNVKVEDTCCDTVVPVSVPMSTSSEPQMTASQLLKIRSQKSSLDAAAQAANQKRLQTSEEPGRLTPLTALPHYAVSSANGVRTTPMPVIIVPHSKLIPLVSNMKTNCNKRQLISSPVISSSQTLHPARAITKIQRIPLQINGLTKSPLPTNQYLNQSRLSGNGNGGSFDTTAGYQRAPTQSQSVILKNLLQQPGSQHQYHQQPSASLSSNGMMPLSVFQNNSKSKRQPFVPYSLHHSFHK